MASQITHIALAYRALPLFPHVRDEQPYFIGTVFPDIRYTGVLPREATHDPSVQFIQVRNETNDFRTGVLSHNLIDRIREEFVTDAGLYYLFSDNPVTWAAMKLYEDEFYYPEVMDWGKVSRYLKDTYTEETDYGISEEDVRHWHQGLAAYFSQPPTDDTRRAYSTLLRSDPAHWEEVITRLNELKENQSVINIIRAFSDQFIPLIQRES